MARRDPNKQVGTGRECRLPKRTDLSLPDLMRSSNPALKRVAKRAAQNARPSSYASKIGLLDTTV